MTDDSREMPLVVTMGLGRDAQEEWAGLRVVATSREEDVIGRVSLEPVAVLVLGPLLRASEAYRVMRRLSIEFPNRCPRYIVTGVGPQSTLFQDGIDDDSVYYLSRGPLGGDELRALVTAATRPVRSKRERPGGPAHDSGTMLDLLNQLSLQTSVADVAALTAEASARLIATGETQCLLYDAASHTLLAGNEDGTGSPLDSAAAGLVGYVARTGHRVTIERPGNDPRYDPDADNPNGHSIQHFVAQPIRGLDGAVIGVITAARVDDVAFSADEISLLEEVATCATPALTTLLLQRTLQPQVSPFATALDEDVYRREALQHHGRGTIVEGRLLTTQPAWLRVTPIFLMATCAVVLTVLVLIRIPDYASGSGVIRPRAEIAVSAPVAGRLEAVEAATGQYVEAGTLLGRLVRLSDGAEEPLWAPASGIVMNLDIRAGQLVTSGDRVASIVDESAGYEFVAFLPASYEGQLAAGMSMFFRIHDHAEVPQKARISAVGPVLLSRAEATRIAGEFLPIAGPVVVVRSRLPPTLASSSGKSVRYRHGMTGDADVRLGSTSALANLMPPLRELMGQ
jgi:hypothetical protein